MGIISAKRSNSILTLESDLERHGLQNWFWPSVEGGPRSNRLVTRKFRSRSRYGSDNNFTIGTRKAESDRRNSMETLRASRRFTDRVDSAPRKINRELVFRPREVTGQLVALCEDIAAHNFIHIVTALDDIIPGHGNEYDHSRQFRDYFCVCFFGEGIANRFVNVGVRDRADSVFDGVQYLHLKENDAQLRAP